MKNKDKEYRVWGESGQFMGDKPIASNIHSMIKDVKSNPVSQADINAMLKGRKK